MKRILSLVLLAGLISGLCACDTADAPATEQATPTETALSPYIMQKEDPEGDDSMNVLFVSNSTCVYFPDELVGLLAAAGYKNVNLCGVYYNACSIKQHYEWLQSKTANYRFDINTLEGRKSIDGYDLIAALNYCNWDYIGFDNNSYSFSSGDVQTALANAEPYFGQLLEYIRGQYPLSKYVWHEMWSNEVGYSLAYKMTSIEQRTQIYNTQKQVAKILAERYSLGIVPTGAAWEKVRDNELITTPIAGIPMDRFTLCTRVQSNALKDDFVHDGDMGGGQYLNACVWFEVLTGKSCVGNTFRPQYEFAGIDCSLSEEKIALLQNAAHEAVMELNS